MVCLASFAKPRLASVPYVELFLSFTCVRISCIWNLRLSFQPDLKWSMARVDSWLHLMVHSFHDGSIFAQKESTLCYMSVSFTRVSHLELIVKTRGGRVLTSLVICTWVYSFKRTLVWSLVEGGNRLFNHLYLYVFNHLYLYVNVLLFI